MFKLPAFGFPNTKVFGKPMEFHVVTNNDIVSCPSELLFWSLFAEEANICFQLIAISFGIGLCHTTTSTYDVNVRRTSPHCGLYVPIIVNYKQKSILEKCGYGLYHSHPSISSHSPQICVLVSRNPSKD